MTKQKHTPNHTPEMAAEVEPVGCVFIGYDQSDGWDTTVEGIRDKDGVFHIINITHRCIAAIAAAEGGE